jgi:hypothetical protein
MKTNYFICAILLFASATLLAQSPDRIISISKDTMEVFVTELTEKVVSFRLQNTDDAPILKMPTRRIKNLESERVGNHDFTYGNPRLQRKTGIGLGGEFHDYYDYLFGVSMDRFTNFGLRYLGYFGVTEYSIYDIRFGLFYHLDSRYNTTKFSPYVGVLAGIDEFHDYVNAAAGLMYNFSSGYFIDLNISRRFNVPKNPFIYPDPLIGLRVGYRW